VEKKMSIDRKSNVDAHKKMALLIPVLPRELNEQMSQYLNNSSALRLVSKTWSDFFKEKERLSYKGYKNIDTTSYSRSSATDNKANYNSQSRRVVLPKGEIISCLDNGGIHVWNSQGEKLVDIPEKTLRGDAYMRIIPDASSDKVYFFHMRCHVQYYSVLDVKRLRDLKKSGELQSDLALSDRCLEKRECPAGQPDTACALLKIPEGFISDRSCQDASRQYFLSDDTYHYKKTFRGLSGDQIQLLGNQRELVGYSRLHRIIYGYDLASESKCKLAHLSKRFSRFVVLSIYPVGQSQAFLMLASDCHAQSADAFALVDTKTDSVIQAFKYNKLKFESAAITYNPQAVIAVQATMPAPSGQPIKKLFILDYRGDQVADFDLPTSFAQFRFVRPDRIVGLTPEGKIGHVTFPNRSSRRALCSKALQRSSASSGAGFFCQLLNRKRSEERIQKEILRCKNLLKVY
jgi:hypothetical protein